MKLCSSILLSVAVAANCRAAETIYGRDSDMIDAKIAAACAPGGSRTVALGRNPDSQDGVWMITRAILLPDDFTLVLDDCRVELAPGTRDNIIRNVGAVGYMRVTPNRNIKVIGRGNAVLCGGRGNHYEPVTSGDRNGWRTMGILLCAVTDYELAGFAMEETQCWGISQENGCSNGWIHDIRFADSNKMRNQDGVDIRKGCHDILVENISGVCGDDVVALTANRFKTGAGRKGGKAFHQIGGLWSGADDDVYNVTVRNIKARCSGGHGLVRLLVQDGVKMHHITVSNVVDTTDVAAGEPCCQAAVRIGDVNFWNIRRNELGEMHHVTVRDVASSGQAAVWIRGPLCDSSVTGIRCLADGPKYKVDVPVERVEFDAEPEGR
ncbi:MAG: glycoside hydrolase family 28 protein [Kiritimatiellae bacterium]|nr:glycoside hydrolase family 28 protein [Kiritimatiellia bacterium]